MSRGAEIVSTCATVLSDLFRIADRARPFETGGMLLGWRDGDTVVVDRVVEVPSSRPDRSAYLLDVRLANRMLQEFLSQPHQPLLGYVGTWHSHPELQSPSSQDRATARAVAESTIGGAVAFFVVATDGRRRRVHRIWAKKGRRSAQVVLLPPIEQERP